MGRQALYTKKGAQVNPCRVVWYNRRAMTDHNQHEELLTLQQVGEVLQVSRRTVERMIERGELTAIRIGPRLIRIRRADLNAYIQMCAASGDDSSGA